jgi:hypothetical protein
MTKTIQFCGDSFCADTTPNSWTRILADLLGASIAVKGVLASAYENVFNTYQPDITYSVFCWTDANRLYIHNSDFALNRATASTFKNKGKRLNAAYMYFNYLNNRDYNYKRQSRELYWFDHAVLYKSKTKAIHIFCFKNTYNFTNGYTFPKPIAEMYNYEHRSLDTFHGKPHDTKTVFKNHLTLEDNELFANQVFDKFNNPLLFA